MILTAGLSNLAARPRYHRNQLTVSNTIDSKAFYIDHHSSITLWLVAHLGTFALLALERFFRLDLMVLDFGRVPNLT
jgi:hypothetical protein